MTEFNLQDATHTRLLTLEATLGTVSSPLGKAEIIIGINQGMARIPTFMNKTTVPSL